MTRGDTFIKALATFIFSIFSTLPMIAYAASISIMQYNVENLMDTFHEPGKLDEDFTPDGKEHWTMEALDWKLKNLGKVVTSIENPDGSHCPHVLVLEEVKNAWVAKRFKDGELRECGYKKIIIDEKTPDIRGIRVAILTKLDFAATPISHFANSGGRNIIEASFQINGQKLTVFGNHWKSRINRPADGDGGAAKRLETAKVIRKRVEEFFENNPKEDILIIGDMNDESEDDSIQFLGVNGTLKERNPDDPAALFWEPSSELLSSPALMELDDSEQRMFAFKARRGTYLYRKNFFQLDHILLSSGLFDEEGFTYQRNSFQVVRLPEFVDPRTHGPLTFKISLDDAGNDRGPKGASDHFPILVRLNYQEN